MANRSQRRLRERDGVDSSGWDGQPIGGGGAPVFPAFHVSLVIPSGAGAGYVEGDILDFNLPGPLGAQCQVRVNGTDAAGGVESLVVINEVAYAGDVTSVFNALTTVTGVGAGAQADVVSFFGTPIKYTEVLTVDVQNLGFGYSVGDRLRADLTGGVAVFYVEVIAENAGGLANGGLLVIGGGAYDPPPAPFAASTLTTITGGGATGDCTIATQGLIIP